MKTLISAKEAATRLGYKTPDTLTRRDELTGGFRYFKHLKRVQPNGRGGKIFFELEGILAHLGNTTIAAPEPNAPAGLHPSVIETLNRVAPRNALRRGLSPARRGGFEGGRPA